MNAPSLSGQVAVVTGAAAGIGQAIAELLAADGAQVMLGDVDGAGLEKTRAAIAAASGGDVDALAGDLSAESAATALIETARARWGRLDILVNNAGGGVIKAFLDHTPETLKQTIDRNLWTAIWCCRAALPVMIGQEYGRIVNIGADSVRNGITDHAAYNAAKGGVHGLTTGLAREFIKRNITVNTVAPCVVATPQVQALIDKGVPRMRQFVDVVPAGRPAEMAEVASMVRYLASPEASFVTGQVISVNGGSTML